MQALVKREGKKGLELIEKPEPSLGPRDVLVRVRKAGLCGTDVHIYTGDAWSEEHVKPGTVIGHEFMGEIASVGSSVTELAVGDRVAGEGHIYCGRCRCCLEERKHLCQAMEALGLSRDGCFAEYVALPARNAFRLPSTIEDRVAAIADPLGNAVHTALMFDVVGEDVLITGAGPIGLMAGAICNMLGARTVVITDKSAYRLQLAEELGMEHRVNIETDSLSSLLATLGIEGSVSVGLEVSGNERALSDQIASISPGGRIALLGLLPSSAQADWTRVIFKGLNLRGIYGRRIFSSWTKAMRLLESGLQITPVITHEMPLAEFDRAFHLMISGQCGKVLFNLW